MTRWTGVMFEMADSSIEDEDVQSWEGLLQGFAEGCDTVVIVDVEFEDFDCWLFGFYGWVLEEGFDAGFAFGFVADGEDEG